MELRIKEASVDQIIRLRHRTLRTGLPIGTARFPGDDDPGTLHFAAFPDDYFEVDEGMSDVVCCASFMLNSLDGQPAWQLRGMATDSELRGRGVGRALLLVAEKTIIERSDVRLLWCNARLDAVVFYEKQGWRSVSEVFEVSTAGPHRKMTKRL